MKHFFDLLGIILPSLIIILSFLRLFSPAAATGRIKFINGFIMLLALLLLGVGMLQYLFSKGNHNSQDSGSKAVPIQVSKHSEVFNQSIENILAGYYKMTDGFVNNDTTVINQFAGSLKSALDSFKIEELKADTLIYQTALQPWENMKAEAASILADPSMMEKRGSFNILSNELFTLLSTVHYDIMKLYWQECDAAFGEDKPGDWLSKSEQSQNPYGQKDCGEVKTKLNFVPANSTKKQ